jgi:hypothetical protein
VRLETTQIYAQIRPARLFGAWLLLTAASVALFERETILTRWR